MRKAATGGTVNVFWARHTTYRGTMACPGGDALRMVHSLIANERKFLIQLTVLNSINARSQTILNFYIFKGTHRIRDYLVLHEIDSTIEMRSNT